MESVADSHDRTVKDDTMSDNKTEIHFERREEGWRLSRFSSSRKCTFTTDLEAVENEAKKKGYDEIHNTTQYITRTLIDEYNVCSLLEDTVEGQEVLEWIVGEYLDGQLSTGAPDGAGDFSHVWISDLLDHYRNGTVECDDGKWKAGPFADFDLFDGSAVGVILEHIDDVVEKYTYVLRWVNEDQVVYYYVGDSIDIAGRIRTHIQSDGHFSAAKRSEENRLLAVESIEPSEKTTEEEKYEELVSVFGSERVYGGM
jgi:predicted GIY-YIG superfamily endonuclease